MKDYQITYYVRGEVTTLRFEALNLDDAWASAPNRKNIRSISRITSGPVFV